MIKMLSEINNIYIYKCFQNSVIRTGVSAVMDVPLLNV